MLWEIRSGLALYQMAALFAVVVFQVVARQVEFASVPSPASAAVEQRFPGASWRQATTEDKGNRIIHEVTVRSGGKMIEVAVTPEGQIVEVERQINPARAPAAVRDALASNYPTAVVRRFEEVSRGNSVVAYEVVFDPSRRHPSKVTFDTTGRVVSERRG
jgi:hypothetical protein